MIHHKSKLLQTSIETTTEKSDPKITSSNQRNIKLKTTFDQLFSTKNKKKNMTENMKISEK